MATYVPAKRATEYIIYVGLESVATAGAFQSSATLASGDAKVSKDGGALANLTTLPAVTPGSSKLVKITLSSAEMDADNVAVVLSDASGGEWKDLIINIPTAARQIDDLATPTNITAGTITTVTNLTNAPTNGDLTATMKASINTEADTALSDVGLTTTITGRIDAAVSTRATPAQVATELGTYDAPTKAELDSAVATLATPAQVNAQMLDVLTVDTFTEPSSVPAATSTLKDKINWLFALARNKKTQTSSTQTLYADNGSTTVATSTTSDDETTATRGEWS